MLVDPRLCEQLSEQRASEADERVALDVLGVSRLLAYEHELSNGPFAEDCLRAELPEVAALAVGGLAPQLRDGCLRHAALALFMRHERSSVSSSFSSGRSPRLRLSTTTAPLRDACASITRPSRHCSTTAGLT